MSDVLELAVPLASTRHADEQSVAALDHLDVVHHEAVVEDDRDERLQLLLVDRENFDLRDLHDNPLT